MSGESERLVFIARAGWRDPVEQPGLIEWRLVLDALIDGERREIVIGDEGGIPFRTVVGNYSEHSQLIYRAGLAAWVSPYG